MIIAVLANCWSCWVAVTIVSDAIFVAILPLIGIVWKLVLGIWHTIVVAVGISIVANTIVISVGPLFIIVRKGVIFIRLPITIFVFV